VRVSNRGHSTPDFRSSSLGFRLACSDDETPVITINTQPAITTKLTVGDITGNLNVSASVTNDATLTYQWYSNTTNSNIDGTVISGATLETFTIPTTINVGIYYFYCEVSATGGATSVRSDVATVNVATEIVNEVAIYMVTVHGGTFTMGCTAEQGSDCRSGESPAHQVTLNNFSIGKYQVTQALWIAVMGSNPSNFKGDNLPVENVSWNDIVGTSGASMIINGITYRENGFIYKLNQQTRKQYRLPTEAEWEYAARGGNQSQGYKYSGSNNVGDVAWYSANSNNRTHPVGTKSPNELDIYDMSGNVWEWCSDWYGNYTSAAKTNPTGPASGSYRVLRGGGFNWVPREVRVSERNRTHTDFRINYVGFRIACSSE